MRGLEGVTASGESAMISESRKRGGIECWSATADAGPGSWSVQPRWEPSPELMRERRKDPPASESLAPLLLIDSGRPSPLDLGERGRERCDDESKSVWMCGRLAMGDDWGVSLSRTPDSCVLGVVLRNVVRAGAGLGSPLIDRRFVPPMGILMDDPASESDVYELTDSRDGEGLGGEPGRADMGERAEIGESAHGGREVCVGRDSGAGEW